MNVVNKNFQTHCISDPYSLWIVDNFLNDSIIVELKKSWPPLESKTWHQGYERIGESKNILEQGMHAISDIKLMPHNIATLFEYFHSPELTARIEEITSVTGLVPDDSMRWSGMRVMVAGASQKIHSDARRHPVTMLRKELTCLIYLNEGYNRARDEGCFEVWNDDMTECAHMIEPLNNRLVIFHNSDTSYHGVPVVNSDRRALVWSIMKNEYSTNRSKAKFVRRPFDDEKIGQLGRLRMGGKR